MRLGIYYWGIIISLVTTGIIFPVERLSVPISNNEYQDFSIEEKLNAVTPLFSDGEQRNVNFLTFKNNSRNHCRSNVQDTLDFISGYGTFEYLLKGFQYHKCNVSNNSAKFRNAEDGLTVPGEISFDEDHVIKIFPIVSGSVDRVMVSLGQYVKKGDVLAIISSTDVNSVQTDYLLAENTLQLAEKNLQRSEKPVQEECISNFKSTISCWINKSCLRICRE